MTTVKERERADAEVRATLRGLYTAVMRARDGDIRRQWAFEVKPFGIGPILYLSCSHAFKASAVL